MKKTAYSICQNCGIEKDKYHKCASVIDTLPKKRSKVFSEITKVEINNEVIIFDKDFTIEKTIVRSDIDNALTADSENYVTVIKNGKLKEFSDVNAIKVVTYRDIQFTIVMNDDSVEITKRNLNDDKDNDILIISGKNKIKVK